LDDRRSSLGLTDEASGLFKFDRIEQHTKRTNQRNQLRVVNVFYRWFDKQHIEPLYSFGYGLSYTSFAYSGLHVSPAADGGADVEFHVKNTGERGGDDVPQVYLNAPSPQGDAQFAVRTLAGFDRVTLAAGEETTVRVHVPKRSFEYWSVAQNKWVRATGPRMLDVGSSSRDLTMHATLP